MSESRTKQAVRRPRTASARGKTAAPSAGPAAEPGDAGRPDRGIELAIIGSVQDALASRLGMQAIYDLVGDRIREVFAADTTFIVYHDVAHHSLFAPYYVDRGVRPATPAEWKHGRPYGKGLTETIIESGKPLLLRTVEEQEAHGAVHIASPGATRDLNRTFLGVPLFRDGRACGAVSVQRYREHAYDENDARLLSTLAGSMSVALENARLFDETQRLLKETEQRAAELQIINSVQSALAARLDIQGIYEAVGDKIREIFHQADVGIRIHDAQSDLIYFPYFVKDGRRLSIASVPFDDAGITSHVLRTREALVINEDMPSAIVKYGSRILGPALEKSSVFVPLIAGDRANGLINILDMHREHAFGDSDVRLLQTLANSMSVALENARLFDETQRLLKETEQRNAELAVIASVQQGIAAELDLQAIIDLVGDKLREVFDTGDIGIWWWDAERRQGHSSYVFEHGVRHHHEPYKVKPGEVWERLFDGRETLLVHNRAESIAIGMHALEGTDQSLSALCMPIIGGDRVLGSVVLEDYERENAFGPDAVRLLGTVVASMGAALENARLFDETQRLFKQSEQRAAELAIVNSVQAALAAKLDVQAIHQLVGDKVRDVFDAQSVLIGLFDHERQLEVFTYAWEKGEYCVDAPRPINKLRRHLIDTRRTMSMPASPPKCWPSGRPRLSATRRPRSRPSSCR